MAGFFMPVKDVTTVCPVSKGLNPCNILECTYTITILKTFFQGWAGYPAVPDYSTGYPVIWQEKAGYPVFGK